MAENNENQYLADAAEEPNRALEPDKTDEPPKLDKTSESDETVQAVASSILKDVSSDIAEEKKQYQTGDAHVKDNHADNLGVFQNSIIHGDVLFGNHKVREVLRNNSKVDKVFDLSDAEQFAEFWETVQAGDHFAAAVILCVFEYVELDDLQDLKSKLLAELPQVVGEDGEETAVLQNSYLSVNSLLKTIKGEMVVLESGEQCVRLGKNRMAAFKNLWQQFPDMRGHIARWLLRVCDSFEYRTNFDVAQITAAFVNILKQDFTAGVSHFFSRLGSDPNHCWLLSLISRELYRDRQYRDKILPFIGHWIESGSSWLWKSAVFVYAYMDTDDEQEKLDETVRKSLTDRCYKLVYVDRSDSNLSYLGKLLTDSERLRTLMASVFHNVACGTHNHNQKRLYCICCLLLIQWGYYFVTSENPILPFVACDKKKQLEQILPTMEIILSLYDMRRHLFRTLQSYLKEISGYDIEKKIIDHLKAFFKLLAGKSPRFRDDIALLLENCNCNLAKEINDYLGQVFPPQSAATAVKPVSSEPRRLRAQTDDSH